MAYWLLKNHNSTKRLRKHFPVPPDDHSSKKPWIRMTNCNMNAMSQFQWWHSLRNLMSYFDGLIWLAYLRRNNLVQFFNDKTRVCFGARDHWRLRSLAAAHLLYFECVWCLCITTPDVRPSDALHAPYCLTLYCWGGDIFFLHHHETPQTIKLKLLEFKDTSLGHIFQVKPVVTF